MEVIEIVRDNQSTMTADSQISITSDPEINLSTPPAPKPFPSYKNVSGAQGWNINAEIGSLTGVTSSQNQFGYWYNDEYSFPDYCSLVYFAIATWDIAGNKFYYNECCTRLPPAALSIYISMQNTPGQHSKYAQKKFVELLVYAMNYRSWETSTASLLSNKNSYVFLSNPVLYVDSAGGLDYYFSTGFHFPPLAAKDDSIIGFNSGTVATHFAFMRGPFDIFSIGEGFSTGLGYRRIDVNGSPYTDPFIAPLSAKIASGASALYSIGADLSGWNARRNAANCRKSVMLPRPSPLLHSRYYRIDCPEIANAQKISPTGNNDSTSATSVAILPATLEHRNEWHQYDVPIRHPFKDVERNVSLQSLHFQFYTNSGQLILAEKAANSRRTTMIVAPTGLSSEDYPIEILDNNSIPEMFIQHKLGVFPVTPAYASVPSGSTLINFHTAKKAGN